jgi:RNA polymerase sigma factor (sigma-70 family)
VNYTPDPYERALVARCLTPENPTAQRTAQRELFERYKRAMFTTAWRILNDDDLAHDALQEGFVEVFRHLADFRGTSSLGAWIKTIMVRQALRLQRFEARYLTLDTEQHDQAVDVPDHLLGQQLEAAIASLPTGARTIFLLAEVEGYAHREIAQLLTVAEGTVKSQVSYARKLLKQRLHELA